MAGRGSKTSRSEATWRDVNQPNACQPETDQPETSRPEASWPETSRRDAPRRDTPSYDKGRLESIQSRYRTIDEQRRLIETWLPAFRDLQTAGIVGEEQRLAWIETLREVAAQVQLPSLRYRIERRTAYEAGLALDGVYRPFSTVVRIEAGLLHEGDLERLIRELAVRGAGLHRIERCDVHRAGPSFVMRPGAINLSAKCDLRWITLTRVEART